MLVLYSATGGRSILAAKTLHDMGFPRACPLIGGMAAWKDADGPIEAWSGGLSKDSIWACQNH